jgi:hypothetical protein
MAKWYPAENFVRNGVRGNYRVALTVSTYHFNALTKGADTIPALIPVLSTYTPVHQAVVDFSSVKKVKIGDRIGDTETKDEILLDMTQNELPEWQRLFGNVYRKKTTKWKSAFPFGTSPFYVGTIEERISAVKALRDYCLADVLLEAIGDLISSFYTAVLAARSTQTGEKTGVGIIIGGQKETIETMCVLQFGDYGTIVSLRPDDTDFIKSFIDWVTLQQHEHAPIYEGKVNKNKIKMAVTKKMTSETKIEVTSDVDLQVWVNNSVNNKAHPAGGFVQAGVPTQLTFPTLGNPANRVLQIQNLSLTTQGNYSIEFM